MQIVIPFAQLQAINPNLPVQDLETSISKYFKCISVSCFSLRQENPELSILVITNKALDPYFAQILSSLDVTLQITPFGFEPPAEFGQTFKGCFYFFDALLSLKEDSLILDPDVICLENLENMFARLQGKVAVFRPNFEPHNVVNGITPNLAGQIYSEYLGEELRHIPNHIGGEAIYFPRDSVEMFASKLKPLWEWNKDRCRNGLPFLTTEEHILTCILKDWQTESLGPYISRIWTTRSFKDVQGEVKDIDKLILWHLPSEKNRGFQTIFADMFDELESIFETKLNRDTYRAKMHLNLNLMKTIIYLASKKSSSILHRYVFLANRKSQAD